MMNELKDNISVIIILYNPSQDDLANVRDISSRYNGVVCDNSLHRSIEEDQINKMKYIYNNANIGIAAAQNRALKLLSNPKYIVFLDQDSRLASDYPSLIVNEYINAKKQFPKLAILGPMLINGRRGECSYKFERHDDVSLNNSLLFQTCVVSSGACTSGDVLKEVGLNEERLFIDLVDSEWCWRANSKGLFCAMTKNVCITHTIGKKIIKILGLRDIESAPFRYFFQTRNYLWMLRRGYVPSRWKFTMGVKILLRLFYLPFRGKDGIKSWGYTIKGIYGSVTNNK